ncbi:MAG: glycosyltransferase family 1 protein, partial [Patescibacteria group bacterium]
MKIGIDCRTILNPSLGERAIEGYYAYALVKNLLRIDRQNQYVLFFDYRMRDTSEFVRSNVQIRHFPFSQYKSFLPFAYTHMLMTAYLVKFGLDVYHSPTTSLPVTYPRKAVMTVHDLSMYKNPSWFPSHIFSSRLLLPQSIRNANRIIAVSESTQKDLQELFNVSSAKIRVVHDGAWIEKVALKRGRKGIAHLKIGKKFILYLGTIEPRKNVTTLIRAYHKLLTWNPEYKAYTLVIAGKKGYKADVVLDEVRELKLGKQVRFIDYVTQNEKVDLMKAAACFVNPSYYEGFAMTVADALALGTPVIASNIPSIKEIVGKAGILFDPEKEYELAAAIKKVLTGADLRKRLSRLGKVRAELFNWETCARQT